MKTQALVPPQAVVNCAGRDIIRKGRKAKRVMLVLPALVAPLPIKRARKDSGIAAGDAGTGAGAGAGDSAAGAVPTNGSPAENGGGNKAAVAAGAGRAPQPSFATISAMDTQEPALYVHFPPSSNDPSARGGRLKFHGRIVHPRAKYLLLRCDTSRTQPVVCEDVFDHVVVFPKCSWVGPDDDESAPLPRYLRRHVAGTEGVRFAKSAELVTTRQARVASAPTTTVSESADGEGPSKSNETPGGERRRSARATARVSYKDTVSSDGGGDDDDDDDSDSEHAYGDGMGTDDDDDYVE